MEFNKSLSFDLREFKGKKFKVLCDTVRSAVKQEHGYNSTKGLTDRRFSKWPIVIRFGSQANRVSFISSLDEILSSGTLSQMKFKMLKPRSGSVKATRFLRYG